MPTPLSKTTLRAVGFVTAICLLGACAYAVTRDFDSFSAALSQVITAPRWQLAGLVLLPAVNWLLTSQVFRTLLRPREGETYTTPSRTEMLDLVGAAWLANYTPIRAGLIGRVVYHKAVNNIPVARTIHSIIMAMAVGISAVTVLIILVRLLPPSAHWFVCAPPFAFLALGAAAGRVRASWQSLCIAAAIRYVDVLVWTARYALAFSLVGVSLDLRQAAAFAAVSQAAMLVPIVGNGLGVREFAIGFVASALPAAFTGSPAASPERTIALTADFLNRAGELAAAIPIGLICGVRLTARMNARRSAQNSTPTDGSTSPTETNSNTIPTLLSQTQPMSQIPTPNSQTNAGDRT